jgi:hypothetical protein
MHNRLILAQMPVRRVLSLPLFCTNQSEVTGVIHLLNKTKAGVVYSEADEVFGQILADHAARLASTSLSHLQIECRAQILAALLNSGSQIYEIVPDEFSALAERELAIGDILRKLEELSKTALKCLKSR